MAGRIPMWWAASALLAGLVLAMLAGAGSASADPETAHASSDRASESGVSRSPDTSGTERAPKARGVVRGGRDSADTVQTTAVRERSRDGVEAATASAGAPPVTDSRPTATPERTVETALEPPARPAAKPIASRAPASPVEAIGGAVFEALLGAAQAFIPAPVIPAGSSVTMGRSTLDIPCGCGTRVDATWYFPNQDAEPEGLIYLQHGFFRNNWAVSALAIALSERTNSVVVTPTLSSNFLAGGDCWINGEAMPQAVAELFEGDRTALAASAAAAGFRGVLPRRFVLSGHSAGGGLAVSAAANARTNQDLAGVVMFDGVLSRARMAAALSALPIGLQVLQIAAPPSAWNDFGSATDVLVESRPLQFVGVRLVDGTHIDSEGASSDLLARLLVGTPRPANVAAVPVLASEWISTMLAGGRVTEAPRHPVPGATAIPLQDGRPAASYEMSLVGA